MIDHDEPNCDPSVDCKFVGPRDCPCRCHATDEAVAAGYESWMGAIADRLARPSDEALAEQQRTTEAYYADPDV